MPELLQTQDYETEAAGPALAAAIVARQEAALSDPGREITVVTGEAALRQLTGGRVVMRDQLAALAETCTSLPHVSVRVLPFARKAHAAACSFVIFRFAAIPELGTVCLPEIGSAEFPGGEHQVSAYETGLWRI